jgi:hypothetical protein
MATFIRLRSKTTSEWLVHPDLRDRLIEEAEREGTNMTDQIVRILADRYRVPYTPGGRKTQPGNDNDVINLGDALPPRLERVIKTKAAKTGGTWIDQIRRDLCDHFDLVMPPKPVYHRKPRTPRTSTA